MIHVVAYMRQSNEEGRRKELSRPPRQACFPRPLYRMSGADRVYASLVARVLAVGYAQRNAGGKDDVGTGGYAEGLRISGSTLCLGAQVARDDGDASS